MSSLNDDIINGRGGVKTVLRLAWPSIFDHIMITMVQYADTAMVGYLGKEKTAAVAINMPLIWLINGIIFSASIAGTVLVARNIGAKRPNEANLALRQAAIIALGLGCLFLVVLQCFGRMIPQALGAEPSYLDHSAGYLRVFSWGLIPHSLSVVFNGALRGSGDTRTPMLCNIVTNATNIIGNYFLIFSTRTASIFGWEFTVPRAGWGVEGAAAATALSYLVSGCLATIVLFNKKDSPVRLTLQSSFKPVFTMIKQLFQVGIPTALERMTLSSGQLLFYSLISTLGTTSLSAHHIAVTAESFCYLPTWGFSVAATTLVGQCLGAQRPEYARRYGNIACLLGVISMTICGILLFLFPEPLMKIFTKDQDVISTGVSLLRIVAIVQPPSALFIVFTGALRGAGDTKWPFYISLIGMWGIRLYFAWLAIKVFGWAIRGVWVGMVIDLTIRGFIFWGRWHRGKWAHAMERQS